MINWGRPYFSNKLKHFNNTSERRYPLKVPPRMSLEVEVTQPKPVTQHVFFNSLLTYDFWNFF